MKGRAGRLAGQDGILLRVANPRFYMALAAW